MGACSSSATKTKLKSSTKRHGNGTTCKSSHNTTGNLKQDEKQEVVAYGDVHRSLSGVQKIAIAVPRTRPMPDLSYPNEADLKGLWTDARFTFEIAMRGLKTHGIEWKRPREFCTDICLFQDGTSKYDVGQGSVGSCWFLCMLAAISDKDYMIQQIFPKGEASYDQAKGLFHCRLWDFGQWIDIVCDDFLPVKDGKPWAARSASFNGEMWVPFLEKALAKYCGSYINTTGGLISRAFRCLTGGITEQISKVENPDPFQYFKRAKLALSSGAIIGAICEMAAHGLVGGHAYTLTGAVRITYQNKLLELLRVRNPWGRTINGEGEWTGPWSDKAPQWQFVDERTRRLLQRDEDDGEFWMSLTDFMVMFTTSIICNVTPDFDRDGTCDGLDHVCTMYGEWQGSSAAGYKKYLNNPLFMIEVSPSGGRDHIPLVVELAQHKEIMGGTRHDIKCYVFELLCLNGKYTRGGTVQLEQKNFLAAWEKIDRLLVTPGHYLIIPSTYHPRCEGEFMLRIFAEDPMINARRLYKVGSGSKTFFTTEVELR